MAERLSVAAADDRITVFFLGVYGGKVTAASRQYTAERQVGHRLFDVAVLDHPAPMLDWPTHRSRKGERRPAIRPGQLQLTILIIVHPSIRRPS